MERITPREVRLTQRERQAQNHFNYLLNMGFNIPTAISEVRARDERRHRGWAPLDADFLNYLAN